MVITEIMQNPKTVADTTGEWFELYNATGHAIDLNGWMLQPMPVPTTTASRTPNGDAVAARGRLPGVGPQRRLQTPTAAVGVAYRYAGFTLGNTDDEIILLDGAGTEIDRVAYDGGPAFPNPDGASMELIRPDLDNTLGANWRSSPDPWPGSAGDRGSPGAANPVILPTSTATATATPTETPAPTGTATWTATATPRPRPRPTTPSPTSTATWTATATPDAVGHTQRSLNGNDHRDANTNHHTDAIGHAEHGAAG